MFNLLSVIFRFPKLKRKQERYLLQDDEFIQMNIDSQLKQRFVKYAVYVPVFIGESFSQLRGRKMDTKERKALTALGALTGLFDDFTDNNALTLSELMLIIKNENYHQRAEKDTELLTRLLKTVKDNTTDHNALYEQIEKICSAQVESRKQTQTHITTSALKEITFNKGGYSMQLYRLAFGGRSSQTELKLFYLLGAIGQLENDLFDIYADFMNNTKTLATQLPLTETEKIYTDLRNEIMYLLTQTEYSERNKKNFAKKINIIIARGFVAIDQLKQLDTHTNEPLTIAKYSRKQLICDMEKPQNILKLIRFSSI